MRKTFAFLIGIIVSFSVYADSFRFAAGSCSKQFLDQKHWDLVAQKSPEMFIWLGDNIYADNKSPEDRRAEYNKLKFNPYYYRFASNTIITGIWDDHDYAYNNAGSEYKYKEGSKQALLEFFDEPFETAVQSRPGIYRKVQIERGDLKIDFVFLDTRSFMVDKGEEITILGPEQREWLEQTLDNLNGDVVFIASGIHIVSDFTFHNQGLEGWAHFKRDRNFLFNKVSKLKQPVVFLSGDRHNSSLSRRVVNGKPIYELMASGLTHGYQGPLLNRFRVGERIKTTNFATVDIVKQPGLFRDRIQFTYRMFGTKNGRKLYERIVRY